MTPVAGEPEIVGGALVGAAFVTVIANAGSETGALPSETVTTMPVYVPAEPVGAVPLTRPVPALIASHAGRFDAEYVSGSPSASDALGWNAYAPPSTAPAGAVPLIVGGLFGVDRLVRRRGGHGDRERRQEAEHTCRR